MAKKAVIYARQSAGSEEVSESVESQKRKCLELAQKEGLNVVGIYEDLNTSGKTYPSGSEDIASLDIAFQKWYKEQTTKKMYRSGLGNVMKSLMDIDYILVYDVTRLYRPVTGSFLESHINQCLMIHNIKVLTVNNGIIDLNNFNDSLIIALQNRINHEQISIQRKKAKDALRKLKDDGTMKMGLSRMYGFKSTGRKREVELDDEEVEMIKDVYSTFLETGSLLQTARLMNTKYTNIFKKPVTAYNFYRILERPIYCGYMYNSEGELIKNHQVDGMEFIPFQMWKDVKTLLEKRKVNFSRAKKGWYPLSGLVYCGLCGKKMKIQRARQSYYYQCKSYQYTGAKPCGSSIHNTFENEYGTGLIEMVYPILSLAAVNRLEISLQKKEKLKELQQLEISIQNLIEKQKKITDLYMDESLDEDAYQKAIVTIKKKKDELNVKVLEIKNVVQGASDFEKHLELLKNIVHHNLSHADFESLLNEVVKRINIFPDKVQFITVYGPIEVPRQRIYHNHNLLPHYWFNISIPQRHMDDDYEMNLIIYNGIKESDPDVYSKRILMEDFGRLKVWKRA